MRYFKSEREISARDLALSLIYSPNKNKRLESDIKIDELERKLIAQDVNFYKYKKKKTPILLRFTIIFALIILLLMMIFLPVNFLITGRWYYKNRFIMNWFTALGF